MFALPSLKDLAERTRQAFRANLKGSDAWIWPNNIYASAKVIAGATFEVFMFAAYIQKQMFAHTAPDIESLTLHGEEYGIGRKPAAPATGNVTFTVTGLETLTVDLNAVLERTDGVRYRVTVGGSRTGAGTLQLPVVASTDGIAGNAIEGTPLMFVSGVTDANGNSTVAIGAGDISLGSEVEGIESYRQRILFRKRNPIHGGAPSDYILWTGQVTGVSFRDDGQPSVFVERLWQGPGTVRVFPLMYDLYENGIPSPTDIQRVSDYLESVKPAGAQLTVAAPVPVPVAIVVHDLVPDTDAMKVVVEQELRDTFKRLSRVAGDDSYFGSMPYLAYPTSFSVSWIWQAVANATGETRHRISSPTEDIELAAGEMATFDSVTFT